MITIIIVVLIVIVGFILLYLISEVSWVKMSVMSIRSVQDQEIEERKKFTSLIQQNQKIQILNSQPVTKITNHFSEMEDDGCGVINYLSDSRVLNCSDNEKYFISPSDEKIESTESTESNSESNQVANQPDISKTESDNPALIPLPVSDVDYSTMTMNEIRKITKEKSMPLSIVENGKTRLLKKHELIQQLTK